MKFALTIKRLTPFPHKNVTNPDIRLKRTDQVANRFPAKMPLTCMSKNIVRHTAFLMVQISLMPTAVKAKASQAIVYGNITVSGSSVISSTPVYKRVCTYMSCASMTEVCQYYETSDYPAPRCTYPYKACCRSAYNKNVSTTTVKGELGKSTALTYYSPGSIIKRKF